MQIVMDPYSDADKRVTRRIRRSGRGMNRMETSEGLHPQQNLWKGFAVIRLSEKLNQRAKLPVLSTHRLRHCKSFFDGRPVGRVFQDMLRLQGEAVTIFVTIIRYHHYNHLNLIVRIYCLFAYENMRITRVPGPFQRIQFFCFPQWP
jgi:hypothetical protein